MTRALLTVEQTAPAEWELAARTMPAFGYRSHFVRFGAAPRAPSGASARATPVMLVPACTRPAGAARRQSKAGAGATAGVPRGACR